MDKVTYRNSKYTGPSGWAECIPKMIAKLIPFSRLAKDQVNDPIYELAVQYVFSISAREWSKWRISAPEWQMLKDKIQWVFTAPAGRPYQSFKHAGVTYVLAKENFEDTTALELSMAFIAYTDFAHPDEPDPSALDRLISTLCRPVRKDLAAFQKSAEWTGDEREPFNEARAAITATSIKSMPIADKVVLLSYFEVQSKAFLEQYEMLFGGDTEPRYGDGRGWIMLLKNIAKEGHFGTFDEVCKQYAHLVYASALDDTITAEELRTKQENEYGQ